MTLALAAGFWLNRPGATGAPSQPSAAGLQHVHGLGINPANNTLYAATHTGLYQVPAGAPARRVGEGDQDTMGFTVVGPDRFLASGHPASPDDGPAHLGLLESTDGGVTWQQLSLRGDADFHALRYRHDRVYGYNATTGQLLVSRDTRTWEQRASMPVRDLAVDPSDPDTLLVTAEQGLLRSTDGGRSWTAAGEPALLLDWTEIGDLWAVAVDGAVRHSRDSGRTWSTAGTVPGTATAFAVAGRNLYVSVAERGIFHSSTGAQSWSQIFP